MQLDKKILSLFATLLVCTPTHAEFGGNVSATSNYLWRGITQTGDAAAVQGGIDYTHDAGLYAGTWASSLGAAAAGTAYEGYELDLYGGYRFTVGSVGMDVGALAYLYPVEDTSGGDNDDSFYEIYLGATIDAFSFKVSYSPDTNLDAADENAATYVEAAFTYGMATFHVGNYLFEEAINTAGDDSYVDYAIAIAKDEFTFGVSNTTLEGHDDPRVFVAYRKAFAL